MSSGQCTISSLSIAGNRTLTATYNGDATFNASSGTAVHRVRYNTVTTISAHAPNPSGVGQAVAISFTVAPSPTGGPAPTGNVTVSDGVNSCTAAASAQGCALTLNTMGARTLTATYAGDAFNKQSAAPTVAHSVLAPSTTTIGSVSPEPSDNGQSVIINYTVTGSGATPTGNVTITDGVNSCTASVATGQCAASFTTSGQRTLSDSSWCSSARQ